MVKKLPWLQASLKDKKRRVNEDQKERKSLFLSEKSLKALLRDNRDDSKKGENLQYQLDCAVAKDRWAQKAVKYLHSQLDTVRATVDCYRRRLANFTERVRTDVTDGFGSFLFQLLQKALKLTKKERDTFELTVKTDFETVHAFLCSSQSKLSRPWPSS